MSDTNALVMRMPQWEVVAPIVSAWTPIKRKISETSPQQQAILGQLERLQVTISQDEFELDRLEVRQRLREPVVNTYSLNAFWDGLGDFLRSYFVRKEEVMVSQVIKQLPPTVDAKPIVIVGSSGVGKSCSLTLIGFYWKLRAQLWKLVSNRHHSSLSW